jgi:hypothetical protein
MPCQQSERESFLGTRLHFGGSRASPGIISTYRHHVCGWGEFLTQVSFPMNSLSRTRTEAYAHAHSQEAYAHTHCAYVRGHVQEIPVRRPVSFWVRARKLAAPGGGEREREVLLTNQR